MTIVSLCILMNGLDCFTYEDTLDHIISFESSQMLLPRIDIKKKKRIMCNESRTTVVLKRVICNL